MLPLSTEFAIREAVRLLRESGRHFQSRQVATARKLLELVLAELPPRPEKPRPRRSINPDTEIDADQYLK